MKWDFFQAVPVSVLQYGCIATKAQEKARWELHKNTKYLEAAPRKTAAVLLLTSHLTINQPHTN